MGVNQKRNAVSVYLCLTLQREENMVVSNQQRALGVFSSHPVAERALHELKASGFPMDKVSIIAKQADKEKQLEDAQVSDRLGRQDVAGPTEVVRETGVAAFWTSILVGLTSLTLPGVGPVLAAGTLAPALIAAVGSAGAGAIGFGNLVRALTNLGVPEEQARVYSNSLQQGDYLAILEGTEEEIQRAETVLSDQGIQNWGIYNSPNS